MGKGISEYLLQKAMPSSVVMTPALQAAGQHQHRIFQLPYTKADADYITELCRAFTANEAPEILRLCKVCAEVSMFDLSHYIQGAITDVHLGFSKDDVRYELYQTCMSNRPDDLETGNAEEQFFK